MSGIGPGAGSLLALTIALSVVGLFGSQAFIERCLFRPYWYLRNREYSTALLAGFVHADLPHLLFNSITFWFFGIPLERRIGTQLFLVLYFAGLAASQLGTWYKHRGNPDYATLGASGAISASATVSAGIGLTATPRLQLDGMSKSPAPANKPLYLESLPMLTLLDQAAPTLTTLLICPM